ncbi:MAG: Nudix family hydrolase [Gammaproteobacteria bacterium]|nr:Nudix family hydrolase [Gammaproteobacteria bacterium]MDP2140169.1 Nudix family hydrolase [Gammaproteobacteria bacterium]MDP2348045.1 Nudix family hydrolase [Gammaproteobacteria bacterium]
MKRVIHVAVGVVVDGRGRVLIALRSEQTHQGGLWEFPGGKCEPDEPVEHALARELFEEVGITVLHQYPFCLIRHDYGDKEVLLDVRKVDAFSGVAVGKEGQPIRWADTSALEPSQFPAANRSIIRRLQLPHSIVITGAAESEEDFFDRFMRLLDTAPAMIQLRAPELDATAFLARATRCLQLCRRCGVRLVLNTEPALGNHLRADGLHVNSQALLSLDHRPVADDRLFGASCHTLEELQHAEMLGADFAFLSPVQETTSHPGRSALGWQTFQSLASAVSVPVFGLGGLTSDDVGVAQRHGAAGIAAISAWWPMPLGR